MEFEVKTPIPGFEHIEKVELEEVDEFFTRLKSCNDETTFMLVNPSLLREYSFEVPEYFKKLLDLRDEDSTLVLNIMIVSTPIETSVVNFIAPFVFNMDKKYVAQVLLDNNTHQEYGIMEDISEYLGE